EVEETRVGELLPARIRAEEPDPTLPELVPLAPVLLSQRVETPLLRDRHRSRCLTVRLVVERACDETCQLLEDVCRSRYRVEHVRRSERRGLVAIVHGPLRRGIALESRDVCGAARGQRAVRLPQHRAVDPRSRARASRFAPHPTALDAGVIDLRTHRQLAGTI